MMNENLMGTSIKDIGRNIQKLSRDNKKLDRYLKNIGTSSDTEQFRINLRSEIHETTSVVKQLLSSIQDLKSQDSMDTSIKLQRLEQNFLSEYTKLSNSTKSIKYKLESTQPHQTQRRKSSSNPSISQKGGYDLSNIHMNDMGVEYENHPAIPPEEDEPPMSQSQAFIPQFDGHLNELENREEAIHQMVDDLSELNSMYKDLHCLVNEQGVCECILLMIQHAIVCIG